MLDLTSFPRHPLTFGPTPIHPLPRLTKELAAGVEIWAKREDCNSTLAYGGNKTRKLEYLVPDALAQGCDTLVSIGGVQSNHTRQVAAVAASLGMDCVLVQGSWVDWPDVVYDRVGNILLSRVLGAEIVFSRESFDIGVKESFTEALDHVRQSGRRPYAIPTGASDHPLGGLGYLAFTDELRAQEAQLGFRFDHIVVASASGSTQAGMVAGFAQDGRARSVIGVDVTAQPDATQAMITKIAQQTVELAGLRRDVEPDDVVLERNYAYPDYGRPSAETLDAIRLCARLDGMLVDPVYEGKSMQGLINMTRAGRFAPGTRVLYVHLGGTAALHAYGYCFTE